MGTPRSGRLPARERLRLVESSRDESFTNLTHEVLQLRRELEELHELEAELVERARPPDGRKVLYRANVSSEINICERYAPVSAHARDMVRLSEEQRATHNRGIHLSEMLSERELMLLGEEIGEEWTIIGKLRMKTRGDFSLFDPDETSCRVRDKTSLLRGLRQTLLVETARNTELTREAALQEALPARPLERRLREAVARRADAQRRWKDLTRQFAIVESAVGYRSAAGST